MSRTWARSTCAARARFHSLTELASNDATKLADGQAQYSALTTPEGTVIDDLLVYRFAEDHLLLVVNAGTTDKDWEWISSHQHCRR